MSGPLSLDADQLLRTRMVALGLLPGWGASSGTPEEVVRRHLAMQAQDFAASRWAIGVRLPGAVDADVRRAYDSGKIVRSWPMRGTVHVTCAEDLPWMLSVMGVRTLSGVARRWEALGIDKPFLERAREIALERLRGGGRCTRGELSSAFEKGGLEMEGQRLYHTVWYLSQTGTLVQGPLIDNDHALVLLDEWIPNPRVLGREEALAELGRRYLEARGVATVEDLVHWTKLTKGDCRKALAAGPDIVEVAGPGGPYSMLRTLHEAMRDAPREGGDRVWVLPAFDEHLLGYRVRDLQLDPTHATLVDPARNGVFRWTLVHNGRVVATWKRIRRAKYTLAEASLFPGERPPPDALVQEALNQWAAFEGTEVRWSWV